MRLVAAQQNHARAVAATMRPRDVEEIRQGWGEPAREIRRALSASFYSRTLFWDLEPMAMYGIAPLSTIGGHARLWMFSTSAIDRHPHAFCRASRRGLAELMTHCTLATNLVAWDDLPARRWLEWLGATYVEAGAIEGGREFRQFIIANDRLPKRKEPCRQG